MDTISSAIDSSQADGVGFVSNSVWGNQGVHLGPFPDVCGNGWVPIPVGIMSMNLETGGRASEFEVLNCLP